MAFIFHIAQKKDWENSIESGMYKIKSLETEGFIHCSTKEQVIEIADLNFADENDLVLLEIDTSKIKSKIIYENLEGEEDMYPHIYGPIEVKAVIAAHIFIKNTENKYRLPKNIQA